MLYDDCHINTPARGFPIPGLSHSLCRSIAHDLRFDPRGRHRPRRDRLFPVHRCQPRRAARTQPVDQTGAGLDGLAQLRALLASGRKPGILVSLDFDFVEAEEGLAVFAGTPGPHAYNPIGTVHGGYAATLLDSACGCAVHSRLSAEQAYTTLELKVAYHKAITRHSGRLRAEGRVLSFGQRVAYAEAKLTDAEGRLLASATSTLLVFARPPA